MDIAYELDRSLYGISNQTWLGSPQNDNISRVFKILIVLSAHRVIYFSRTREKR